MSEEEVIQFISACWNKFGEHTATLVSAEQADIELFLARLKDDLDELRGNNKTLQATIAAKDAEIARLLAVEVAAKKLDEALEWVMKDYEDMCRKSLQKSANWKKRLVMAKASSKAFQRSINPIGERK